MIIHRPKCKIAVTDLLLVVLTVLYSIGIRWWFPVCQATEEKVMSCHWAGRTLEGLSWLLLVLAVLHLILPDEKIKAGMAAAFSAVAVFTMMVPGTIISLCGSSEMPCRSGTALMTTLFMAAICLTNLVDVFLYLQIVSGKKHKRKEAVERP